MLQKILSINSAFFFFLFQPKVPADVKPKDTPVSELYVTFKSCHLIDLGLRHDSPHKLPPWKKKGKVTHSFTVSIVRSPALLQRGGDVALHRWVLSRQTSQDTHCASAPNLSALARSKHKCDFRCTLHTLPGHHLLTVKHTHICVIVYAHFA